VSKLDQQRREFERRKQGAPKISTCYEHEQPRSFEGEVCLLCYAEQQARVERESLPLRYANTAPALRDRVRAELAAMNGA
jgi:hypothetical protein